MWQIVDGHWIWLRGADPRGYGVEYEPEARKLHRRLWEQDNGKLSEGEFLKKTCDVFRCHNPAHYKIVYSKSDGVDNSREVTEEFRRECAIRELERGQAERERAGRSMSARTRRRWIQLGLTPP